MITIAARSQFQGSAGVQSVSGRPYYQDLYVNSPFLAGNI